MSIELCQANVMGYQAQGLFEVAQASCQAVCGAQLQSNWVPGGGQLPSLCRIP